MKRYPQLRHSEEGLASISLQGDELCVTLGRALMLDDTHQASRAEGGGGSAGGARGPGGQGGRGRRTYCSCPAAGTGLARGPRAGRPQSHAPQTPSPPSLRHAQVVGRLCGGRELLPLLNGMRTDINDAPQHRVRIARCGFTNAGARRARGHLVAAGQQRRAARPLGAEHALHQRCRRHVRGL